PGPVPDLPGVDLRQQPDQRPGFGRGLAARAVRHVDLLAGHHGRREQAVAEDRWRRGPLVQRRTYRNAWGLMTTNTTGNAATAAGTIGQAGRGGGTSVLLRDLTRAFGATRALD